MRVFFASYQSIMLNKGGPTYVVLNLEKELTKLKVDVRLFDMWNKSNEFSKNELLHVFNASIATYSFAKNLISYGAQYVVNPIFYSNHPAWKIRMYRAFEKPVRTIFKRSFSDYYYTNFICENAKKVLPNTKAEGELLSKAMRINSNNIQVIHNGVEERFLDADSTLFVKKYGLKDFVLNVGHIGAFRKNSYKLIKAVQKLDVPTVIIADVLENTEAQKCMEEINKSNNIKLVRWIKHDDPLLASAYAACKTFVLPSRYETPGIVAMEAALAGANVVNTPYGGTKEYFADYADYLNPNSIDSIANTIEKSLNKNKNDSLKNFIKKNFLWSVIAKQTLEMYEATMGK
jgi:glycosyltransferase involved in cell wall biosynthesis